MTESIHEMPRGQGRGVNVLPLRVRRARQDAGLTLAQLADGKVSRTAIHLIETGRSRPSPDTLEHIASRTGKPVSYFVGAGSDAAEPDPSDIARQAEDLMRQTSWKLAHLLRRGRHLTGPERAAVEGMLIGIRHNMRLIQALNGDDAWARERAGSDSAATRPTTRPAAWT